MNGISYLSLDAELLQLMKAAGFSRLNLALVSSDTSVLETTKRPHTVGKYLEVVETAHRLGFEITSYQILGLPFESLSSMVQTLVFSRSASRPSGGLAVLPDAGLAHTTDARESISPRPITFAPA